VGGDPRGYSRSSAWRGHGIRGSRRTREYREEEDGARQAFYESEFMEEHKKMVEAMDEAVGQYNDQNGTSTTINVTSQNIATGALVIGKAGKKG